MDQDKPKKSSDLNSNYLIGAVALGIAIPCLFTGHIFWTIILGVAAYANFKKGNERFEAKCEKEYRALLAEQERKPDSDGKDTSAPAEVPNEESTAQNPESACTGDIAPAEQKKKKPFYKRWWFWTAALLLLLGSCGQKTEPSLAETEPIVDILVTLDAEEILENPSIETAAGLIRATIEETEDPAYDGYEVRCSDDLITVNFWSIGALPVLDAAINGDTDSASRWNKMVDAQCNLCASYYNLLQTMGLTDVSVAVNFQNAVNRENSLLTAINGITVYNYLDVALATIPVEASIESMESTLTPEEQMDEILATYHPEDFEEGQTYILNTSTMKFHYKWCSSVDEIRASNKMEVKATRSTVVSRGYTACKRCSP